MKFIEINFKKDELNHLIGMEDRIKSLLKKLLKANKLTKKDHDKIYPSGSRPGVLYGLGKVHKKLVNGYPPFRPILSALGTPTYNLSKYLVPIMSKISVNKFTISKSFDFAREITRQVP